MYLALPFNSLSTSLEGIDILYTLDSASLLVKLKPRIFQRLPPFNRSLALFLLLELTPQTSLVFLFHIRTICSSSTIFKNDVRDTDLT